MLSSLCLHSFSYNLSDPFFSAFSLQSIKEWCFLFLYCPTSALVMPTLFCFIFVLIWTDATVSFLVLLSLILLLSNSAFTRLPGKCSKVNVINPFLSYTDSKVPLCPQNTNFLTRHTTISWSGSCLPLLLPRSTLWSGHTELFAAPKYSGHLSGILHPAWPGQPYPGNLLWACPWHHLIGVRCLPFCSLCPLLAFIITSSCGGWNRSPLYLWE